jgi:hypothetical protein
MSNSFPTPPPTLADETTTVAGQPIAEGAITAMSQSANYLWHYGATSNVMSQAWAEGQMTQKGTSYRSMLRYIIPTCTRDHYTLKVYAVAKGSGCIKAILETSAGKFDGETCSTGAGPHLVTIDVVLASTIADEYVELTFDVKHTADTTSRHEIAMLMARWEPLASPVTAGKRLQGTDEFIPFGIDRVGADYPLSSRWGRNMLTNVDTLRRRPQLWLSWSGVENLDSAPTSITHPAPAKYLYTGDIGVLGQLVHIPQEAILGGEYTIYVSAYVTGLTAGQSKRLSILGHTLTFSSVGWNHETLTVEIDPNEDDSALYHLNIHRVQLDNNGSTLDGFLDDPGLIGALCVWGI